MAVRGEEVATSIEAHVRESIDRMVAEIRSSIEDVRDAVDSQLKAALQSVQADVNSITFLPHIQKQIGELEESLKPEPVEAPAPLPPVVQQVAGGPDASRVKNAVQTVERGKSQVDVLNALLEECLQFGSRAALLILRGETFSGWKGVGFSAAGGNDEMVKRFNAAPGLIPELDSVLRDEHVIIWDGANLSTRLGVPASSRAILVPMVIKDKVAAAVYVDAVEADMAKLDAPSVELLVFCTGLLIDTLALRKKTPSPSLIEEAFMAPAPAAPKPAPAPAPAAPAPPPAPPKPAPQAAPAPSPRPAAPPPQSLSEPAPTATMRFDAAQIKELMAGAAGAPKFNVPSAEEFSSPTPPPRPAPAAPAPPPPAAAPAPAAPSMGSDERPTTQYVPPAGVGRGSAFNTPQSEDAKKHDEARRFARLLVSEIKLYNESKVEQGRKNRDLYERLKEDIDRSRQMYDERIADEVRKTSNYFYDELVRILADGRAEVLGL
ncbi:MAG TPA: hypothetical protein VJ901_21900 [Thermoanaerobaculia bacterium]|nr:hypothetical protein [Thermoanaerobaculia bacterium]